MDIKVAGRRSQTISSLVLGLLFVAAGAWHLRGVPLSATMAWAMPALFIIVGTFTTISGVRTASRIGFRVDQDGLHGAHHAEGDIIPWAKVARLGWGQATERRRSNNRTYEVTGNALFAYLKDGRAIRVTQQLVVKFEKQERIDEQLRTAKAQGLIPVPFEPDGRPPADGHDTHDDTAVSWPTA